jgi:hypothetical protein
MKDVYFTKSIEVSQYLESLLSRQSYSAQHCENFIEAVRSCMAMIVVCWLDGWC